jgi:gluconolactonase
MMTTSVRAMLAALTAAAMTQFAAAQPVALRTTYGKPDGLIDLRTAEGVELVRGQWRYSDAKIVEVDGRGPGPDRQPSGTPLRTHDLTPKAGVADFDDSGWEVLDPTTLDRRRSTGKLCFNWYRIRITIPQKIGAFDPSGATVVFEVVVDDYAEIWINGAQPKALGQSGGAVIRGFNAPNRVVIARAVKPGQQIQLAILGINGPLSDPPANFIWVKSATLDFYKASTLKADAGWAVARKDPAIDAIVPSDFRVEKLASGFGFTEGPVWSRDGYLLFSDPNNNTIYRWAPDEEISVFRPKSGYTGMNIGEYGQPGSNGLTFDGAGRLTICEHGNRRVTRLEKNGVITVLADRFEGKRLNSPNDLVYRSDGTLYFTDPPFGLPKFFDDPRKELPFSGVFCVRDGSVRLVSKELSGPNGLAFSPDEKFLYVGNWDEKKKVVMCYQVLPDGASTAGTVFFDMTAAPGEDAIDGIKVDRRGNLYVSGPGGIWILSPDGKHLGTIHGPEQPHNLTWGDDGRMLYMTAQSGLYRTRLNLPGIAPQVGP